MPADDEATPRTMTNARPRGSETGANELQADAGKVRHAKDDLEDLPPTLVCSICGHSGCGPWRSWHVVQDDNGPSATASTCRPSRCRPNCSPAATSPARSPDAKVAVVSILTFHRSGHQKVLHSSSYQAIHGDCNAAQWNRHIAVEPVLENAHAAGGDVGRTQLQLHRILHTTHQHLIGG